jgi:hypothetical protein
MAKIYTNLNVKHLSFLSDLNETWIISIDLLKILENKI